jgi:DNA-binding CsgD family transcriptional regulator/AraC-like DNA-binding protein
MAYSSYSDIIIAIYQAAIRPELWAETLDLVADYLGVDSGMVLHQSVLPTGSFIVHRRLREDLNQLFLQHYTKNPYAFAFARAPIGKALVTEALIEKEALHRSAFYADILAPQGIAEIIAVRHPDLSREGVGGILFNVSMPRADDAEHAATRLDRLVSHLSRAMDFTLLTSRLNASQRQLHRLLASVAGAAILLDRHGGILQMTAAAETLLGQRDGLLAIKYGYLTLSAQTRDDSTRLTTSIKQALAVARGEAQSLEGMLQIKRPSGRRALLVQVTPLPPQSFSPWDAFDAGARVMVQIVDPQASTEAQAERLRLLMGLTGAETRVAALLGSGLGLTETASALGVSLNTVKTHTRQVFAKAGVRSAAALVRLMASIPIDPSDLGAGRH